MSLRRSFVCSVTAGLGLLVAQGAFAQSNASSKAAAEALFDEGLKQMKAGQFAEACPKLEESQRIDPGVGTLLYLAECYEKSGRVASAWATFREAASLAGASGQGDRERTARDRAQKLEGQLSYITIVAAPETKALRGLTVTVGANALGSGLVGTPTPIDPGEQRVEVSAPGREPFVTNVKVETARRYEVNVPVLREQPQSATTAQPLAEPPPAVAPAIFAPLNEPAPSKANPLKTIGIVAGGVGLVGVGIGSYFGLRAISKMNEATDEGSCANGLCQDAEDLEKTEQASDAAVISNIAFAAGGALLVTGVALYVFAPDPKQQQGLRVSPYFTGREGGIAVGGQL